MACDVFANTWRTKFCCPSFVCWSEKDFRIFCNSLWRSLGIKFVHFIWECSLNRLLSVFFMFYCSRYKILFQGPRLLKATARPPTCPLGEKEWRWRHRYLLLITQVNQYCAKVPVCSFRNIPVADHSGKTCLCLYTVVYMYHWWNMTLPVCGYTYKALTNHSGRTWLCQCVVTHTRPWLITQVKHDSASVWLHILSPD